MTTIYWIIFMYLCVGTFLSDYERKLRHRQNYPQTTFKESVIIVVLWGVFIAHDIFIKLRELYNAKSNKALENFEKIENEPTPRLIAFVGYSGSGKDTAADYFVKEKEFTKFSFASALKALCFALYWHKGIKSEGYYNDNRDARKDVLWTDESGKEWTPVDVWVEVGTKIREVYADTWLDMANGVEQYNTVIADCRHENELKRIKELGGTVVYIDRKVEKNPSAKMDGLISPEDCDIVIDNNKTLEEFYAELDKI